MSLTTIQRYVFVKACLRDSIQALIRQYNEEFAATLECVQQGLLQVNEQSTTSAFERVVRLAVSGPMIRSLLQTDTDPARRSTVRCRLGQWTPELTVVT